MKVFKQFKATCTECKTTFTYWSDKRYAKEYCQCSAACESEAILNMDISAVQLEDCDEQL